MHCDIGKGVLNSHLGSNPDPCYIQNRVITNRVIKRLKCISKFVLIQHILSTQVSDTGPMVLWLSIPQVG